MTSLRILFFLLFFLSAVSRAEEHRTWCTRSERELFSCTFSNHKVASLCATADWSRSSGGLQYRFGKPESRQPEMIYPKAANSAANFRALSSDTLGRKENTRSVWLSFKVGKYRYVIQDDERDGTHRQVIKVAPDDKPEQTLICNKNTSLLSQQSEKILYLLDEDAFDER